MAGKAEAPKVEAVEVKPKEDGSLDDILEGAKVTFTGHPAMGDEEAPALPPEVAPGAGEVPSEKAEGKAGEKEGEEKPAEFKPKYATHELAEKAEREAERKMHEATTLAKQEKEAREALEEKFREQEAAKPPEKPAEEVKPVSREERKAQLVKVARVANKLALEKIADLDRTDPDYQEGVALAWAEANAEALLEVGVSGPSLSEADVTKLVRAQLKTEREAAAEDTRKEAAANIETRVEALAMKAGLDMTPGSLHRRLLYSLADDVPEDVKKKALEEQVDWAVGEIRTMTGKEIQSQAQLEEDQKRAQEGKTPLGRGSTRGAPPKPKDEQPTSLAGIFEKNQQARTA